MSESNNANSTASEWSIADERAHMEQIVNQRFNFLLVFVGLVVGAAAQITSHRGRFLILGFGSFVSLMMLFPLGRAQHRFDIAMKIWERKSPANIVARIGRVADTSECLLFRCSYRRFIGYKIPLVSVICLFVVSILAFPGFNCR